MAKHSSVPEYQIDGLVLAAGQSSRMVHHKILLPTKDGHSVLSLLLEKIQSSITGKIVVVLGRDAEAAKAKILASPLSDKERLIFVTNAEFQKGMSTSLKLGVSYFDENTYGLNGLAVFLADQPLISEQEIALLKKDYVNRVDDCLAVAAAKGTKRLNPVIFSPELLQELKQVSGDVGAKVILQKHKEKIALVDLGDGLWSEDMDDWDGYVGLARAVNWTDAINFINSQD